MCDSTRDLIEKLLYYTMRFADMTAEPPDGDCRAQIDAARAYLNGPSAAGGAPLLPEEDRLLADPGVSYWLKTQLLETQDRDPLDALADGELLLAVLRRRFDTVIAGGGCRSSDR